MKNNTMQPPPILPGLVKKRKTPVPPTGNDICEVIEKLHMKIEDAMQVEEKVEVIALTAGETKFASLRKRNKGIVAVLNSYRPDSTSLTAKQKQNVKFFPKKGYTTCGDWLLHTNSASTAVSALLKHYNDLKQRQAAIRAATGQ